MTGLLGIGVGAGAVSALLTLVITTGSSLSLLLFFAAPLPIAIAALGWNHRAGLIAAIVGAAITGLAPFYFGGGFNWRGAATHAISTGLPAWWFSFLALLARSNGAGAVEWYPVGRVLAWIAGVVAAITLLGVFLIAGDYESYVRAFDRAVELIQQINPRLFEDVPADLRPQLRANIAALVAGIAPPISAAISVLISATLMVVAARVVLASGRLPRPWPYFPATMLPNMLLPALAASLLVSFLGGFLGLGGRIVFAALAAAYALQGLAVLHAIMAGRAGRGALLGLIYVAAVLLGGWPLIPVALFGVADALFGIRRRRGLPAEA